MNTNSRGIIIAAAAALVISFFLPWIAVFNISAWDLVFGRPGELIGSSLKYVTALIPLSGLLIVHAEGFNEGRYAFPKRLLFILPILTLLFIAVTIGIKIIESGGDARGVDPGKLLKIFGIGFWLTLVSAIILPRMYEPEPSAANKADGQDNNTAVASPAPVEGTANDAPVATTVVETP